MKKQSFGDKIRRARERLGIGPTEAAARAGMGYHQWRMYEADRRVPNVLLAWKVADALEVGLDELRPEE